MFRLNPCPLLALWAATLGAVEVHVVVAQDGSGDYKTIQYAVDHAPTVTGDARLIIEIRPGIYRERVVVPRDRGRVTFRGSDAARTIITAAMSAKAAGGTFFSSTVDVEADEFHAEKLTVENTFGTGSQAVALKIHSDRALIEDCRFLGWQDTLYAASGRQYYRRCWIEGHVDFIFGNSTTVFEDCHIHNRGAGYVSAQSRTLADGPTGFVFLRCRLTGENTGRGVYLGRPWRAYSRVLFLHCWLGAHIFPEGWSIWTGTESHRTSTYGEFDSTGPGANPQRRAAWTRQLKADEVAQYLPENFLAGTDHWGEKGAW
jgi:pectinesterase